MIETQNINSVDNKNELFHDLCGIIDEARRHVATYVNVEACLMNWHVGRRIKEDVLFNKRAEYGKQIINRLSEQLTERYGAGWSVKTLRHCLRAAETFTENEIVSAAQSQFPRYARVARCVYREGT